MHRTPLYRTTPPILIGLIVALLPWSSAHAEKSIRLRNGFVLRGAVVEVISLNENAFSAAASSEVEVRPIWMVDDGLRRVYIHKRGMVAGPVNEAPDLINRIELWQPTPVAARAVAGVGTILHTTPFNAYGRRQITIQGPSGPIEVLQGISEINPRYTKISGLKAKTSYSWDMRVSTASISSETLREIFAERLRSPTGEEDLDRRLEVVRFYIEAERFAEARRELQETIDAFPEATQLPAQLRALVQRQARQVLDEALVRRDAGQYTLALQMLRNFPRDEVARETRLEVQDQIDALQRQIDQAETLIDRLREQIESLEGEAREELLEFVQRMHQEMSFETLPRLSDYQRLGGDETLPLESRVALGISGWMLGSGAALQNLAVATSMIRVRELVAEYLASTDATRRAAILEELHELEGAEPQYVSKMLPLLPPPWEIPQEAETPIPGLYRITLNDSDSGHETAYWVQLPPEYNPLRPYPCVLALPSLDADPTSMVDWWAGPWSSELGMRMGQATRHGFVVVVPEWWRPGQSEYEYSPREHHRVLTSLRDAMRRVSIDADRVFLSGHHGGGTAAWDIGLSHPDLWAGMISISGEADKYVNHYGANATRLPMYFVMGEIAGAPAPLIRNGSVLNSYMHPRYNAMLVMYRGRGPEHFYEEIHHLFDWMQLSTHRRPPPPAEINASTMRRGDQFFWWLELPELLPNVEINPILWEHADRLRAGSVEAQVTANNSVRISKGPARRFVVYLAPSMGLDFSEQIAVQFKTRRVNFVFDHRLDVMLEDARTRADRQQPYWGRVEIP